MIGGLLNEPAAIFITTSGIYSWDSRRMTRHYATFSLPAYPT